MDGPTHTGGARRRRGYTRGRLALRSQRRPRRDSVCCAAPSGRSACGARWRQQGNGPHRSGAHPPAAFVAEETALCRARLPREPRPRLLGRLVASHTCAVAPEKATCTERRGCCRCECWMPPVATDRQPRVAGARPARRRAAGLGRTQDVPDIPDLQRGGLREQGESSPRICRRVRQIRQPVSIALVQIGGSELHNPWLYTKTCWEGFQCRRAWTARPSLLQAWWPAVLAAGLLPDGCRDCDGGG
mmetsp:Transcript_94427/g.305510  ORF Transcript_94427/g.305510 Transcript_94427/m.305510 type:complete len:245 (-) Transcript_94427:484-1218(-)